MTVDQLDGFLLAGTVVLLAAILAVRLSVRIGLPSLLAYLLMGVALGESGLGIEFDDASTAHALGFAALVVILAEGGLSTRWSEVRPAMPIGVALATVGVAASVGVMAMFGHFVLGLSWQLAVLLGAVTAPTDAAAVFSVLRRVPLPRALTGVLEVESGLNDAPTVLLVTLISTGAAAEHSLLEISGIIVYELGIGIVFGAAIALFGVQVLRSVALPASGLYPITVLAFAVLAYAGANAIHASGFAAVYVAALVLGNADLPHRLPTRSFAEGLAWLAQIGVFVMLGLLATPSRMEPWQVGAGLLAGAVLTFVARPVSVLASATAFGVAWRQQAFLAWCGLRGAVPIVLATIPLAQGAPGATDLFDVVFVMVVIYTLLQGPLLPWIATRLGVAATGEARDVEVEAAPLDRLSADLLQVHIPPGSRLHGVEVGELRLPVSTSVSLIVRDQSSVVPESRTVLRTGDDLLIVTPRRVREETEARLHAVGRGGRLATWLGQEADRRR